MATEKERVVFLDYLRAIACMMVVLVHSCEPFYLGGDGTYILNRTDAIWVTIIDSMFRACVPLFVIASSYLLFPVKTDTKTFYTKRAKRVMVPFLIWLALYAFIPLYGGGYDFYAADNLIATLKGTMLNFPGPAGHLWFVYMLLGLYLFMPLLSPWIEKVSKKGEEAFLLFWCFTTLTPFLRLIAKSIYGSEELWGEANWNEFGTLYYFSGYIGYLVLGHYFRTYIDEFSWKKTLFTSIPMLLAGFAISAGWFYLATPKDFPVNESIDLAVRMEASWRFCSLGVLLTTVGFFLIIRKFNSSEWGYRHIIRPISNVSYGIYLMHIFFLCFYSSVLRSVISSTPAVILLTAVLTYATAFIFSFIISKIPKAGKWIIG